MTLPFRKISAFDQDFKNAKERHIGLYNKFKDYTATETIISGKAKNNQSGKSHSYANYLIRLIMIYEDLSPFSYNSYFSLSTYYDMQKAFNTPSFQEYNREENHYPSATMKSFHSFLTHYNDEIENQLDDDLNHTLSSYGKILKNEYIKEHATPYPMPKDEKRLKGNIFVYPRDPLQSQIAKQRSGWKCEYDTEHYTFTSFSDKKPFMEAHHLIPMAMQDDFEYTLDFADNIVSLCPTCHRLIHYGINSDREKLVTFLYEKKKDCYPSHGIDITLNKLLSYYNLS